MPRSRVSERKPACVQVLASPKIASASVTDMSASLSWTCMLHSFQIDQAINQTKRSKSFLRALATTFRADHHQRELFFSLLYQLRQLVLWVRLCLWGATILFFNLDDFLPWFAWIFTEILFCIENSRHMSNLLGLKERKYWAGYSCWWAFLCTPTINTPLLAYSNMHTNHISSDMDRSRS
jgi:hypothetical protein